VKNMVTIVMLFAFLTTSCKQPTAPKPERTVRDYTWPLVFTVPGVTFARVKGTSESNLIAVGGKETVLHFDGKDVKRVSHFSDPEITYHNPLLFQNEVFIKGRNAGSNYGYILHGK
jgi:hypothetical protein